MNDAMFTSAVRNKLRQAGHLIDDNQVSISIDDLAKLLSQHNVEVIAQFIRLQRKAGIQTVRYLANPHIGVDWLVDRMSEFDLLLEKDKQHAAKEIREQIIDISPVANEQVVQLCSQHKDLHSFGLKADIPL